MSNLQLREKLREITAAAKNGEQIPERPKRVGLMIFYLLAGAGILVLIFLSIALFLYGYKKSAIITFIAALFFSFTLYKVLSAEDLPDI